MLTHASLRSTLLPIELLTFQSLLSKPVVTQLMQLDVLVIIAQ